MNGDEVQGFGTPAAAWRFDAGQSPDDVVMHWVGHLVVERVAHEMRASGVSEDRLAQELGITRRHLTKKLRGQTPLTLGDVIRLALIFGERVWPTLNALEDFFPQPYRPHLTTPYDAGIRRVVIRRWPDDPVDFDWPSVCAAVVEHIADEPIIRPVLTAAAVRFVVARRLVALGCTGTLLLADQPVAMLRSQVPTPGAFTFVVTGEAGETGSESVIRLLTTAQAAAEAAETWRIVVAVAHRSVVRLAKRFIGGEPSRVGAGAFIDGLAIGKMLEASGSKKRVASIELRTLAANQAGDDIVLAWAVTKLV